uniref:Aldehyde dehydrogenase domain-containing protein n=1 Tax=Panagrolaimus sp. JU765 TaxID=591449 RepID=A0AC34R7L7_9BILA
MMTEAACELLLAAAESGEVVTIDNFIGGHFVPSKQTMPSIDPATGQRWLDIPKSDVEDVNAAVSAAKKAFKTWSKTSVQTRSKLLNRVADILEPLLFPLAELESKDQGKTITTAKMVDIPRCIHNFRTFASAILHHTGTSSIQAEPAHAINYVQHDPIGVAALISPWNLPLYLLSFKLAPALACGNTVVAKPSEMTSATAYILMHAFREAGFPPGVVNLVIGTGAECGEPLVSHEDVALVSFTGSTAIGKRIAEIAAKTNKKVSLEMGGKNAGIIFGDVAIDEIMPTIVNSCFANQGEICLCTERLYVHSSIFDQFLQKFAEAAKKWRVGDPKSRSSNIGALISKQHFDKVNSYFELAKSEGATIHCGGPLTPEGRCEKGYFFTPTIITDVENTSRLLFEEVFGPFVVVNKFETRDEVIEKANSTKYGLSASVFSKNIDNITVVAKELRVGTVWCNCWMIRELNMPFGGTKESGNGRDGTVDSFDFYSEKKTVCIKIDH